MCPTGPGIRPRTVKRQISAAKLHTAFIEGGLGIDEDYPVWTPLWALRAKIWQQKKLKKDARKMLGKLALEAIEGADAPLLRRLADSLERMLQFERSPENALKAGDQSGWIERFEEYENAFSKSAPVACQ